MVLTFNWLGLGDHEKGHAEGGGRLSSSLPCCLRLSACGHGLGRLASPALLRGHIVEAVFAKKVGIYRSKLDVVVEGAAAQKRQQLEGNNKEMNMRQLAAECRSRGAAQNKAQQASNSSASVPVMGGCW